MSHPTGVRGLKSVLDGNEAHTERSHPTGVRGLKYEMRRIGLGTVEVAPHWGARIEISTTPSRIRSGCWSHPTGVRGLKSQRRIHRGQRIQVAPHWGAWIEITLEHPRVIVLVRRTPLGCVD